MNKHLRDALFFDNMLTPKLIAFVYWLALAGIVIAAISIIFSGNVVTGLLTLIFGAVATRIFCELLIVIFKMNEALQDIRNK